MDPKAFDFNREYEREAYSETDLPKYPARTLCIHVAMKGAQLGSALGLVSVLPFAYFRQRSILSAWKVTMPFGSVTGILIAGGLMYGLAYQGKLDINGVDDRAFRISRSLDQTKIDRYSFVGSLAGASVGVLLSRGSLAATNAGFLSGISVGMAVYKVEKLMQANDVSA